MRNYFSMFPEEMIASFLDAFVINKPMSGKVGGDGFWIYQDDEDLFIALFDCVGHSHLASMMTRVYTQTLQKLIQEDQVKDPGTVLRYLHHKIESKFNHKDNTKVHPAADLGLIKVNLSVRKVEYSGAKIDLMQMQEGRLKIINGDKMPIGDLLEYPHGYQTEQVPLKEGVKSDFYLTTDGFRDLIGGPQDKRLGRKGIYELLKTTHGRSMILQKEKVMAFIDDWRGSNALVDDLLIVGFSV